MFVVALHVVFILSIDVLECGIWDMIFGGGENGGVKGLHLGMWLGWSSLGVNILSATSSVLSTSSLE